MPSMFRPWETVWLIGKKKVPADTPGARKVTRQRRKYYAQGIPGYPPEKRFPLSSDKTAAEQLSFATKLFPDRVANRLTYASALAQGGARSEAIAQFKEVLRLDPSNETAQKAISWLYSQNFPPR